MIDSRGRDSGCFPEEGKGMRGCEAGTNFCGERQFRIPLQTTQAAPEDGVEVPYQMMTGKIPPFASDRGGVFFFGCSFRYRRTASFVFPVGHAGLAQFRVSQNEIGAFIFRIGTYCIKPQTIEAETQSYPYAQYAP